MPLRTNRWRVYCSEGVYWCRFLADFVEKVGVSPRLNFFGAGLLGCVLVSNGPATARGRPEYDPAACKADAQGKRYIALGRYVLATPYSKRDVYLLDPLRPGNISLVPPDPTGPEGCPGNPLQS